MRAVLLLGLIAANTFDAVATLSAVSLGVEEANPIMRVLLDINPALFLVTKLVVVSGLIGFACVYAPKWLLLIIWAAYAGVMMIHVWGWVC